jgi:zinc protease
MEMRIFSRKWAMISNIAVAIAITGTTVSAPAAYASEPTTTAAPSSVDGWGQPVNDLKPDPAIRQGVLPNGMKYALQKNHTPKGGASIRFTFDVGFADEDDNEVGIAHYVEHMAFNGSTKIPEGELIKKLERLGLAFGADTNAETNVDFTTYKLDLPSANAETIDAALLMMRELASELTISQAAVERERGIIISEKQVRNVPQRRRAADWIGAVTPGTRLGARVAGDDGAVIKTADAKLIRAFYNRHYRPERATMAIAGDFDLDAMEKQIRDRFAGWSGKGAVQPKYVPTLKTNESAQITGFSDPTLPELVELQRVTAAVPTPNTMASERQDLLEGVATIALNKRFEKIARNPESGLIVGQSSSQKLFRAASTFGVLLVAKDGNWQKAIEIGEQEMRRAADHGFTQAEIAEAIAALDNVIRNGAAQANARQSSALAEALVASALTKSVLQSPADTLAMFEQIKLTITQDAVKEAFRSAWGPGPSAIHITTKGAIANLSSLAQSTLADSRKVAVVAPAEAKKVVFAYDSFGKPGKVTSDKRDAASGIRKVQFANGVRLNIRKTDFEADKIHFGMRVGGGSASLPTDKPGLGKLLEIMSAGDGFEKHSIDDLQQLTAGRTVQLGLKPSGDAFESVGVTTGKDVELQMKLLAASLSAMGYRDETQAQWPEIAKLLANSYRPNPIQLFVEKAPNILASGDNRFGLKDLADLEKRSMAELKAAIDGQLKSGPVELALVGDVDEAQAISFVANTLGALPKRATKLNLSAAQKVRRFPDDRSTRVVTHDGKDDQGLVVINWPTTDDSNLKSALTRDLLASILGLQLTELVREQLGATYTPNAFSNASSDFAGFGHITALAPSTPANMDVIVTAAKDIASKLRAEFVSEDLLLRARKPIAESYERQSRENAAWVGVTNVAQSEPERVTRRLQRSNVLASVTPADIMAMAQLYLKDDAALELRIVPKSVPATK